MTSEASLDATPARSSIAVAVGIVLCIVLALVELGVRHWAAFGVFGREDWAALFPDFHGRLFDYLLGLGVGAGVWAVLHRRNQRGLVTAAVVGGASIWLAPNLFAVLYVWRVFGAVDWGIALNALLRTLPHAIAGAFVAGLMWRIAYRRSPRVP